jgi:hypothetical protein
MVNAKVGWFRTAGIRLIMNNVRDVRYIGLSRKCSGLLSYGFIMDSVQDGWCGRAYYG